MKILLICFTLLLIFKTSSCSEIFRNETNFDLSKFKEKLEINVSFSSSFLQSFIIVFISELADKTFIIILLFSTKRKSINTFTASLLAVLLTNYLSIFIGLSIDVLLYKNVIDWIAFFLFIIYGVSLLSEACEMSAKKVEDKYLDLVEIEYKQKKKINKQRGLTRRAETEPLLEVIPVTEAKLNEASLNREDPQTTDNEEVDEETDFVFYWLLFSSIFTAECGDKSQISTIIISAVFNIWGVIFGTTLALMICVYINFFYGHNLANYLTERHVNTLCGFCFMLCGTEILLIKLNYLKF